ncbi:MAG: hypothetical protein A3H02_03140 [Candidatus Niyogibacteria bacterium RIFCSPLOWO2_12_FULL_41_13]|uniref:UDP-N-acetylglucosamine--N-acetylmuramyl-(pentapeptide) pyrophosphoryl-undecaprenol N-acetylglucosamine transferase n=1 Tax=Candidatus Niyogibacteria bacterium RIFCSPLOWO2_12_FULL_41_13 TaxID=1801726 RepID=A0A1G2F234_9BACT|nr:MAG: hypothetical protein A3H02_03140 [Candidatus Niyogibacteria bacterium RIFCSPLOWO2_12_FULL_41_13]
MKIYLVGGGTGGHFFPLIAVARALRKIGQEEKMISLELIYAAPSPYDKTLLVQEDIKYRYIPAGKVRRYFSFWNFTDFFKTGFGFVIAIFRVFLDFPDVIFSKGGYASFPILLAARIFRIPLIIHESDVVPGRINDWAKNFADKIAISFAESLSYFPEEKTALAGNPVRKEILGGSKEESAAIFGLEPNLPTILVIGGSQGAQRMNDAILDALESLLKNYQIVHQAGSNNFQEVKKRTDYILDKNDFKSRYHLSGFLDEGAMRGAGFISDLIVARAGAGAIFEIAAWGKPSILIPLRDSAQNHQRENAYAYARAGAAEVIEEENLTKNLLVFQIDKIINDKVAREKMVGAAFSFAKIDAAEKIAREILKLGLKHAQ